MAGLWRAVTHGSQKCVLSMTNRRLPTLGPDNESNRVRLYLHQIEDTWAAMLVADDEFPPEPGMLKGLGFFGATPEEAEHTAKMYLGCSELVN